MGRVLGIVTVDDVIDAIVQESTEDVQKLGGVEPLEQLRLWSVRQGLR
jgi:magnesium transporter